MSHGIVVDITVIFPYRV